MSEPQLSLDAGKPKGRPKKTITEVPAPVPAPPATPAPSVESDNEDSVLLKPKRQLTEKQRQALELGRQKGRQKLEAQWTTTRDLKAEKAAMNLAKRQELQEKREKEKAEMQARILEKAAKITEARKKKEEETQRKLSIVVPSDDETSDEYESESSEEEPEPVPVRKPKQPKAPAQPAPQQFLPQPQYAPGYQQWAYQRPVAQTRFSFS